MSAVPRCSETNPEKNRDPWILRDFSIPEAFLSKHTDMIGGKNEEEEEEKNIV